MSKTSAWLGPRPLGVLVVTVGLGVGAGMFRPAGCPCGAGPPPRSLLEMLGVMDGCRRPGNEAAAIGALKTLTTAQALFAERSAVGGAPPRWATLMELRFAQLIDPVLGSGKKQGYRFRSGPLPGPSGGFWATAEPVHVGCSGQRSFYACSSGIYYATAGGPTGPGGVAVVASHLVPLGY